MSWRKGQAFGQDLRDRVLQAPGRVTDIAKRFDVSPAYVSRIRSRRAILGQTTAAVQCNHMPLLLSGVKNEVLAHIAKVPDQTLVQLCEWAHTAHGIVIRPSTMHKNLVRFGVTYKKKRFMRVSSIALT